MCGIFIDTEEEFALFRLNGNGTTGARLFRNRAVLAAGLYIVLSTGMYKFHNECKCLISL